MPDSSVFKFDNTKLEPFGVSGTPCLNQVYVITEFVPGLFCANPLSVTVVNSQAVIKDSGWIEIIGFSWTPIVIELLVVMPQELLTFNL